MTQLQTERLILRPYKPSEGDLIHRLMSDQRVYFWHDEPGTLEEANKRLKEHLERQKTLGMGAWAAFLKESNGNASSFVGQTLLQPLKDTSHIELAYHYVPAAWGKGYATEAGEALLRYGFETLKLDEIVAMILPENQPSQQVISRLGLTYIEDQMHHGLIHRFYVISRADHLARRSALCEEA